MSTPLRKKGGNTLMWILMAMLILGLGGFGITNFGGARQAIGSVGDRDITVVDYGRALQQEMRALSAQQGQPVGMDIALALGLDKQVQGRLFSAAALDNEAERMGLSAGDAEVARRITEVEGFRGLDGKFDRETYRLALREQGMTEGDFEADIRDEVARGLFQRAVAGGLPAPSAFTDALSAYLGETRDFTLAELLPSDLAEPVPEPTDEQVAAYYEANPESFTKPETRVVTYVWLKPEDLADEVEVDEAAVRAVYDARISEFVIPERRLVERLVFSDDAAAADAKARIDAGEVTLADLAAERGLAAADIDLGEATRDDLGAAADAVFALTEPGIAGPVATDLGPALYAMNGILAAEETPFEEVRDELEAEARAERARRAITERSPEIEDLLASGASLEDVAQETGMALGTVEYNEESEDPLAGYPEFREAAAAATPEDFPELIALSDGGVIAIRLDRIDPPALRPLDEVREQAVANWTRDETRSRLKALAEEFQAQVDAGASLESLGVVTTRYEGFGRGGHLADTPPEVAEAVFATDAGKAAVVDAAGRVHILAVTAITPVDPDLAETQELRAAIAEQARQGIAQDVFTLFTRGIEDSAGITFNEAAINAVHTQIQ